MVACVKVLDFTPDSGGGGHRLLCFYSKKLSEYVELVTATVLTSQGLFPPICMHVLPEVCIYMYAWCLQRPEEGVRSLGTGAADGCEPPFGC